MWGMKGKYWDDVQPGDKTILDEPAEFHLIKYRKDGNKDDQPYYWNQAGLFQNDMNTRFSSNADLYASDGTGGEKLIALTSIAYKPYAVRKSPSFVIPPEIGDKRAVIATNISNYINQNLVEFFTGKKSVDKDWDNFLQGLDGLQVKDYIDLTTQAYNQYKQSRSGK
jgi:putative aldouronate transport system substrate-binding protein